ncbi:MAG TPA: hypothetical protein PLN99_12600, partial [Daejeonella sp.]|nr:hypothetical protein [Daejeonella sp.]
FKLRIAGSYLLRQGLFYPGLFFIGTDSQAIWPSAVACVPHVPEINKESHATRVRWQVQNTGIRDRRITALAL